MSQLQGVSLAEADALPPAARANTEARRALWGRRWATYASSVNPTRNVTW
jgi:hypothetical protein